jgi:hypothetical protein
MGTIGQFHHMGVHKGTRFGGRGLCRVRVSLVDDSSLRGRSKIASYPIDACSVTQAYSASETWLMTIGKWYDRPTCKSRGARG